MFFVVVAEVVDRRWESEAFCSSTCLSCLHQPITQIDDNKLVRLYSVVNIPSARPRPVLPARDHKAPRAPQNNSESETYGSNEVEYDYDYEDPNFPDAVKFWKKDVPRTVNGTGHTGPSEFCATSI